MSSFSALSYQFYQLDSCYYYFRSSQSSVLQTFTYLDIISSIFVLLQSLEMQVFCSGMMCDCTCMIVLPSVCLRAPTPVPGARLRLVSEAWREPCSSAVSVTW